MSGDYVVTACCIYFVILNFCEVFRSACGSHFILILIILYEIQFEKSMKHRTPIFLLDSILRRSPHQTLNRLSSLCYGMPNHADRQ